MIKSSFFGKTIAEVRLYFSSKIKAAEESLKGAVQDTETELKKGSEQAKKAAQELKILAKEKYEKIADETRSLFNESKSSAEKAIFPKPSNDTITGKMDHMAENVIGKVKEKITNVKESVKESINPNKDEGIRKEKERTAEKETKAATSTATDDPLVYAKIDPMGEEPHLSPLTKTQDLPPMNKETEKLQREGAKRKAEEDSFNLM